MNSRKILALVLALLLALPSVALAGGSFTLKVSDPVLTLTQNGETTTQDLTGVALQLGGAADLEAAMPEALLSLVLLANDDPAASAMLGMKDSQLYALATGITHVITLPVDKIEQALAEQGASLGLGNQAAALADLDSVLEKFQFTEGPAEDVQFYVTTGNCPRHSAHLTAADLKDLLKDTDTDLPEDASLDISYFEDGQGNLRIEGSANNVIDSENEGERSLGYVFVAEIKDEMNYQGGAWIGNTASEVNVNFAGSESADYPGKAQFELVANLADADTPDESMIQLQASLMPNAAEDGTVADVLNISVLQGNTVVATVGGAAYTGETDEYYSFSLIDNTSSDGLGLEYQGTIAKTGADVERQGALTVDFGQGDMAGKATLNLTLNPSEATDGKFPDISGMPALDLESITDEQLNQLTQEATQLAFSAMGKMMAVPAIAAILASTMQTAS